MITLKLFGILLVVTVVSNVSITTLLSKSAMASSFAGQTSASIREGTADLDVVEAIEADNTSMMPNQTNTENTSSRSINSTG